MRQITRQRRPLNALTEKSTYTANNSKKWQVSTVAEGSVRCAVINFSSTNDGHTYRVHLWRANLTTHCKVWPCHREFFYLHSLRRFVFLGEGYPNFLMQVNIKYGKKNRHCRCIWYDNSQWLNTFKRKWIYFFGQKHTSALMWCFYNIWIAVYYLLIYDTNKHLKHKLEAIG